MALESQLGLAPIASLGWKESATLPKVALTSYKALVWYVTQTSSNSLTLLEPTALVTCRTMRPSYYLNTYRYASAKTWTGPTVLILGGSGGTGSTGIQLSRVFGAENVITTTSAKNFAYVKELGATRAIDYTSEKWWEVLGQDSVDVVYGRYPTVLASEYRHKP